MVGYGHSNIDTGTDYEQAMRIDDDAKASMNLKKKT